MIACKISILQLAIATMLSSHFSLLTSHLSPPTSLSRRWVSSTPTVREWRNSTLMSWRTRSRNCWRSPCPIKLSYLTLSPVSLKPHRSPTGQTLKCTMNPISENTRKVQRSRVHYFSSHCSPIVRVPTNLNTLVSCCQAS